MPGIEALSRVQFGVESTPGTTVPATARWASDIGMLKDNLQMVFPKQKVGLLGGSTHSYIPKTGGELQLMGDATFEQLGYVFNSGIYRTTPTTDTSSAQVRTWNVQAADTDPISTSDLDTLSVEAGDNNQAELMSYGFVREWSLDGNAGEALQLKATIEGRAPAKGSFTPSIAVPTVESILFSTGALYIDPSTDAAGTTIKSNTLLSMSLKHTTGWVSKMAKDNRTDFSFIKRIDDVMLLDLTFEHDAVAVAAKDAWRAQTEQVIRLTFKGTALSTTDVGAPYDTKILVADLYGSWLSFDAIGAQDGNNILHGQFRIAYSSAAAKKATLVLVNQLATLP